MSDQILYNIDKDDVDKGEGILIIDRPAQKNAMNDWVRS